MKDLTYHISDILSEFTLSRDSTDKAFIEGTRHPQYRL